MSDLEDVPAETPLSPEEAIIRRHRREKRELQGKIVAMKKSITKNDKKKKKDLADEIARLEKELDLKHKLELDTFRPHRIDLNLNGVGPVINEEKTADEPPVVEPEASGGDLNSTPPSVSLAKTETGGTPYGSSPGTPRMSRAAKRREKKSVEDRERQKRIEQETEILVEGSEWKKEDRELEVLLKDLKLEVFEIPSDGHCLYSAVAHQIELSGEKPQPIQNLRKNTAEYLLKHKDEFIAYFDGEIGESSEKFENYCKEIETTAAWGGQIEVQVLSKILERPIRVIQARGAALVFGEEYKKPVLNLTYHRHKIQLGEHYNSAVPLSTEQN